MQIFLGTQQLTGTKSFIGVRQIDKATLGNRPMYPNDKEPTIDTNYLDGYTLSLMALTQ